MGFMTPTLPDLDVAEWEAKPRLERIKPMAQHWAENGFGTPWGVYIIYAVKIGLYILGGLAFAASTPGIGSLGDVRQWWDQPIVFQKVVIWTLMFEVLGFGCGFGPLTLRFIPPIGGFLHWLRPDTIRLPPWPDRVYFTAGTRRTPVDVALYTAVIVSAIYLLLSPGDRSATALDGSTVGLIETSRLIPLAVLLPILGLRDKTIFLAARSEHYWVTLLVFFFPYVDMVFAAKLIMVALWWGAATSKLNKHFPFVVATMMSNAPLMRVKAVKRALWRDFPDDIRPSRLAAALAHGGTVVEFVVPLILLMSSGGWVTQVAVVIMVLFHLQILTALPMGVPLEWNVMMIFSVLFLFGHNAEYGFDDVTEPLLVLGLVALVAATIVWGNLRPAQVSFLPAMRYYAGNWATSMWAFSDTAIEKFDASVTKSSVLPLQQLQRLYPADVAALMLNKGYAFRALHSHGRALFVLGARAAGPHHESCTFMDGEFVAGVSLGWNFGEGHLHNEQLLEALQERCQFEDGELRVVILESQPLHRHTQHYRLVDAATGQIEEGHVDVDELVVRQPWDGSIPSHPMPNGVGA
ncbi:MAG: DUF3556 domain-containing protein [Aeromicrobium sp.]